DGGYERRARQVVDDHREFFGFDARQLVLRRVVRLDLAAIGSSDKVAVVFDQVVEGVPVRAGSASVLFDAATGDLLALDSTGVPGADRAGTFPVTTIEQAVGLASDAFAARHGVLPTSIESYRPILLGPSL